MAPTSRCRTPPPPPPRLTELVCCALCRAEPSRERAGGGHNPPGMGGVAPLVEPFKATLSLRGLKETKLEPGFGEPIDVLLR